MEDTLYNRIEDLKTLTKEEVESLVKVLCSGCRQSTKESIECTLFAVPRVRNRGIFRRVIISPRCSYCAGQSYPDELRTVRELLK